jgi:hypothetical protein
MCAAETQYSFLNARPSAANNMCAAETRYSFLNAPRFSAEHPITITDRLLRYCDLPAAVKAAQIQSPTVAQHKSIQGVA